MSHSIHLAEFLSLFKGGGFAAYICLNVCAAAVDRERERERDVTAALSCPATIADFFTTLNEDSLVEIHVRSSQSVQPWLSVHDYYVVMKQITSRQAFNSFPDTYLYILHNLLFID